ncbi:MAG: ABC transporter permease [Gemmatimonadales bacterium]|nr:ABC transporter permease [Gemmatimonadales bacterium]
MHKVWAVIRREFIERVRTKWFWVATLVGPLFFAAIMVIPVLMARSGGVRQIAVVDDTPNEFGTRVAEELSTGRSFRARRVEAGLGVLDSLTAAVEAKALDGFLILPSDVVETGRAEYRGSNVSSMQAVEDLQRGLNRLIVKARLEREGVNPAVVDRAQIRILLDTKKISRGRTTAESAGGSFIMAYIMAVLLFMAILLYGVNVMSSVLEEKTNRIMEVLVSSLKPFEMMLGKVLGAGSVSLLQFLIWALSARLLMSQRGALLRAMGAGGENAGGGFQMPPIPGSTIAVFLAFFLGGFLLYSAMFAAVGAMSRNEQEARQAQQPVTFVLMIAYLSIFALTNDPNSAFSRTLSMVPFTSPIAMPVRWTAGSLPLGEVLISVAILIAGIAGVTWVAARIYRVGILMTGKRPTLKELVRWVRA